MYKEGAGWEYLCSFFSLLIRAPPYKLRPVKAARPERDAPAQFRLGTKGPLAQRKSLPLITGWTQGRHLQGPPKVIRESRSRICDRGGSLRPKQRESGVMAVDWLKIKTEYINDLNSTYRSLAEKHHVSQRSIAAHAVEENWVQLRKQQESDTALKIQQKTVEKIADNESEIAAIKSRLRLRIYEQLEQRMSAEEIDGNDFRRLVQSYKDMCDIKDDGDEGKNEGVTVIIDV